MLKIRLRRMGAKKAPFYRIVVADSRKAVDQERCAAHGNRSRSVQKARRYRLMSEEIITETQVPDIAALVEFIAKSLVDEPSEVKVAVKADEAGEETTIELSVAKDDMGKVIGKQGRIAKAIRTVVRAASVKSEKKYRVDIL